MKRLILAVAAIALLAVPAAEAQKINKESILSNLSKQDANVADAKKAAKAATWIARGKAYFDALDAPTKDLPDNTPRNFFENAAGKPSETGSEVVNGTQYTTLIYPYFVAYEDANGTVVGWRQTREIKDGLFETALESYNKALELDPKQKDKIGQGMDQLYNYCIKCGNVGINVGDYKAAAQAFANAYEVQKSSVYEKADPVNLFFAGRLATVVGGQGDVEMFKKGAEYLEQAVAEGYIDEDGSIYYFLFHCYYGQRGDKEQDADNYQAYVTKSRDALLEGIAKYPKNDLILDGLLNLYTAEDGVGDPKDLVGMIDQALEISPDNIDLWYGRGRVYYKLNDFDECIKSFDNVIRLRPDDAQGFYLQGVFYMSKAEAELNAINDRHYTVQSEYDRDSDAAVAIYKEAIPYFERAIELNPNDLNSLELLKQIYFRFRDEDDNMSKYEQANARLEELRSQQ